MNYLLGNPPGPPLYATTFWATEQIKPAFRQQSSFAAAKMDVEDDSENDEDYTPEEEKPTAKAPAAGKKRKAVGDVAGIFAGGRSRLGVASKPIEDVPVGEMGAVAAKKRKVDELWAEMNGSASISANPKAQAKDTGEKKKKKKGKKSKERRKAKRDQVGAFPVACEPAATR